MLYRVKQFIWAITAPFIPINEEILNKYLNKEEKILFDKLCTSDKHHSIRVCKDALNIYSNKTNIDERKLAKIALLHDIGKSEHKLNVIEKSALVVLDGFMNGKFIKYSNNKKVDLYYNHPKKSINMLKKSNGVYDKEFLEAIEKHHYKNIGSNIYLKIIKECDDNN